MARRLCSNNGFTLVELVAVLIILGLISAVVASRFANTASFEVLTTRDNIVAGLFYAQQTALARGNNATIQFVANGGSVTVQQNGTDLDPGNYPLVLPSNITLTPNSTLMFDKLGRTTATTFVLNDTSGTSATITVEASGYVH